MIAGEIDGISAPEFTEDMQELTRARIAPDLVQVVAKAALLDVVASVCDPGTTLVLPAGAPARVAAGRVGVPVLDEGFCDRAYGPDAALVGRQHDGAVYDDPALAAAQALALATEGTVVAVDGTVLPVHVDTLCLHGDSPNALAMARAVRAALTGAGITIAAPPRP